MIKKHIKSEGVMLRPQISLILTFGMASALFLSSCKTEDDYRKERVQRAAEHFDKVKKAQLPGDKILSMQDCLKLAMQNNMEMKVQNMEKDAAKNMMIAEILGMLPDLSITDGFTARNNQPGSSSKAIASDGETYGYSTSANKNINNLNIDLAFSLLDFGLAYFNSQQSHDRLLLKEKQIERIRQNLILDVVRAYYKVAATQRAIDVSTNLLNECKNRYALIEQLRKENKITPFRAFEEVNRFLDMEKRLTNYTRSYETSCMELRSLLGVYPSVNIIVDDSVLDKMPEFDFPDIELLEQIAILKRPELYEIDIQRHINILECRKTILMMLPNVNIYMDFINNNNSFLYNQTWWELAVRAAYNVLKTPQNVARYMAYSDQADIEELRSFAQAITVMSQVRIAKADIVSTRERFEINRREHRNYSDHLKKALAIKTVQGSLSQLEVDHLRLTTAETEIERLMSLGAYHIAHYRLLNAIGMEKLDAGMQKELKSELDQAMVRAAAELEKARVEYAQKQAAAEDARIARILFDDGVKYYNQQKPETALEYFNRAAQKGNASAMFCIGKLYWVGKGVPMNRQLAAKYFRDAADHGNVEAMVTTAWLYYKGNIIGRNLSKSKDYYRMAAENGDDRSYYWLGSISYEEGDFKEAMEFFKKAARVGDLASMVRVGCLYRDGKGEEQNFAKAMEWFKRAADKGDADAMNNISMMYAIGEGVGKDPKMAEEWFRKFEAASVKR